MILLIVWNGNILFLEEKEQHFKFCKQNIDFNEKIYHRQKIVTIRNVNKSYNNKGIDFFLDFVEKFNF